MTKEIETSAADAPQAGAYDELVAALEGRPAFYHLLASIFFKPLSQEEVENIADMDFSAYEEINGLFDEGINDMRRYLRRLHSGTRQELAVDFTGSLGGVNTWKGKYATPYESVFTSEEGLMFQDSYHEVFQLFRKQGISRAEGYDYPDDHLSFMCEFMAIESDRAAAALREGDVEAAYQAVTLSRGFLADHILSWYDDMAEVANLLCKTRFYHGVLKVAKGFFLFDAEVLDDIAAELAPEPEPEAGLA